MTRHIAIATLLILSACGDVTRPGSGDAGEQDGTPDGAVPGPVTVTVLSFDGTRTPAEGIPVGFFSPTGAHQETVETDAEGTASADLPPGGAVVAFLESAIIF